MSHYYVPGIVLSILHLLITQLIVVATLWAQDSCCSFSHYTDEETELQRGYGTCHASYLAELGFEPRHIGCKDCVLCYFAVIR